MSSGFAGTWRTRRFDAQFNATQELDLHVEQDVQDHHYDGRVNVEGHDLTLHGHASAETGIWQGSMYRHGILVGHFAFMADGDRLSGAWLQSNTCFAQPWAGTRAGAARPSRSAPKPAAPKPARKPAARKAKPKASRRRR